MDTNKILLEVFIPIIEEEYDVFVPVNKTMGTIKKIIERGIIDLSDNGYMVKEDTNLYSKETGDIYNVNLKLIETDLKNGSQVILI
ncbi:MAG: hypothetical protein HFJ12_02380 [Bacilli bacterium]|nr:hypothetical protein [Bacilli bacterium]